MISMTVDESAYLLWLATTSFCGGAGMYLGREYAKAHDACMSSARKAYTSLEALACSLAVPALTTVLLQQTGNENAAQQGIFNLAVSVTTLRWQWQDWQTNHVLSQEEKSKPQLYYTKAVNDLLMKNTCKDVVQEAEKYAAFLLTHKNSASTKRELKNVLERIAAAEQCYESFLKFVNGTEQIMLLPFPFNDTSRPPIVYFSEEPIMRKDYRVPDSRPEFAFSKQNQFLHFLLSNYTPDQRAILFIRGHSSLENERLADSYIKTLKSIDKKLRIE